jgi:hypothetical protein
MAEDKDNNLPSNITVQRQQYGQTVYLERTSTGVYHETTNPNFGGGISSQQGNVSEGASTINSSAKTEITSPAPSPTPKPAETKPVHHYINLPPVVEALKGPQQEAQRKYLAGEGDNLTVDEIQLLGYEVKQRLAIEHKGGKYGPEGQMENRTTVNQTGEYGVYTVAPPQTGLVKGQNLSLILNAGNSDQAFFEQTSDGKIIIPVGTTSKQAVIIANYASAVGQEKFYNEQQEEAVRQSEFTWSRIPPLHREQ